MKGIIIPESVKKEIEMALAGRKIVKKTVSSKKQNKISKADLLRNATENFNLINRIANTEPLRTLIVRENVRVFIVLAIGALLEFREHNGNGSLILRKSGENAGIYYWHDADYPANRSESDYKLLLKEDIESWHQSNLEILAGLNQKKIWAMIKKSIRTHRRRS